MRLFWAFLCLAGMGVKGEEAWPNELAGMLLPAGTRELNRTNCVELMLRAFRSNQVVKALIFMPGATDEFYMFRRAKAALSSSSPCLLDAISALTNQTLIRATFRPPLLLLHTEEDFIEPDALVEDSAATARLKNYRAVPHLLFNDRDWDAVQPELKWPLKMDVRPWRHSTGSWHFYRHSLAGWNLSGWEALEAVALAGKSRFTIRAGQVIFAADQRVHDSPPIGTPSRGDGVKSVDQAPRP